MPKNKKASKKVTTPLYKPSAEFSKKAHVKSFKEYEKLYKESIKNPKSFWTKMTKELSWIKPWKKLVEWKCPFSKWFLGGKINVSANCLDRHVNSPRRNKAAIIWEGEPGEHVTLTYQQLLIEVCKFANVLKAEGVKKGDVVAIYMPQVPEAAVAMLACARIGAPHTVVFGGFSTEAIKDRVNDCKAKVIVTADGGFRRGKIVPLKENVDNALSGTPSVKSVIVVRRTNQEVIMKQNDHWYHELMEHAYDDCPAEALDSEHPLFILYTSGSTGKPKGVLHTTAGYLLGCYLTTKYIFDIKEEDIFWCTADVGWITGHSYVVYGALSNGATTLMYEGAPNHPEPDRFWQIIDHYKVNVFYTAPTAIRAFMKWGDHYVTPYKLDSLRLLGSVGEPINPEAWLWYYNNIGKKKCPIVDTWWQTETGAHMLTTLPGAAPMKPGSAGLPFFGVDMAVVDDKGKEVPANANGKLIIKKPWPFMLRNIWGDSDRFKKAYWSEFKGMYFTGDGAQRDKDGYYTIIGRIDDVLNVAGHRIGTAEIESVLITHPSVAESAVVGKPDELKGQALVCFVTLRSGKQPSDQIKDELKQYVAKAIGAIARPDEIRFTEGLPKTRSGKIMRRLLKEIAVSGEVKGDTTTLEDFSVIANLKAYQD
jgi:acetyl-CoA synthetase